MGPAELPPLGRVAGGGGENLLGGAGAVGAHLHAADVQGAQGHPMPLADLAEEVLDGNRDVVELHRAHRGPLQAEQALVGADGHPRGVPLEQEGGERGAVDLGEEDEQVGPPRVGDPLLGAVHDVVLALGGEHRRRPDVHGVGAGLGLGQRERRHQLAAHAAVQVAIDLGGGAEVDEGEGADALVGEHRRGQPPELRPALVHAGHGQRAQAEPAVRLGHLRHENAEVGRLPEQGTDDVDVAPVDLVEPGRHLLLGELPDGLHQQPLVVAHVLRADDVPRLDGVHEKACSARLRHRLHADCIAPGNRAPAVRAHSRARVGRGRHGTPGP